MSGTPALTVAVLCGGASRRMGTDKRGMTLDGQSMLDRAIARITPIASTVIIASGSSPVRRRGAITVMDGGDGRGPLAGIVAALQASPHSLCAAVAVDMPDIDMNLLVALAARCAAHDAALPLSDHGVEPLHAVYARSALRGLRTAADSPDPSMRGGLSRLRVSYVLASSLGASPGFARNLNTPADARAWRGERAAGCAPQPEAVS